ncbi:flagellar transcriptional regulator FlhC [Moellerella wisconsensis]|uniref:Flagellar transcriptional regulator FlhC n=3 Tax=Moellerella wisconsensis TaxID=158849 RepID=A0A0N0Z989_9GAMM|nr:flagellar transcriptional regulator FlhC [Moellerella wisconsensis]KLN96272.1 transcriptional regulator [Moellerella wisconsensis]KPD02349.1 FlhC family flagellar transcriptional activator [Moellerella wisconsensis ATCC 35017]UNH25206.1 flagellar transcriptional regulator FlhC [Moellerella wisconsensis]UNH28325.1 flagellar transcriptional regulator FlhC [Moellerella wisconsensis]UNH31812.1 flagellar transcriptional regulator FlhC [Moellerella wisconsensis]
MVVKSIVQEAKDITLAIDLIKLGARLQMLESETQISRGRLIKLYKELKGYPPPKGMLPFSTDWFMTWEHNIHSSMFYNIYYYLTHSAKETGIDAVIKSFKLYLEQCPAVEGEEPILGLTRAWTLIRFIDSNLLQLSACRCCKGHFVTYAHQPINSFICSLCQPPSRAIKRRKHSHNIADVDLQVLNFSSQYTM